MSESKTIAIVGDSKGIGAALREQLLAAGHRVFGVSRSGVQREGAGTAGYQSLVFDAVTHPCDLSGFAEHLDGLVYCPGTIRLKPLKGLKKDVALEDWNVNAWGAAQTLQTNFPLLQKSKQASVVLLALSRCKRECHFMRALLWRKELLKASLDRLRQSGLPKYESMPSPLL